MTDYMITLHAVAVSIHKITHVLHAMEVSIHNFTCILSHGMEHKQNYTCSSCVEYTDYEYYIINTSVYIYIYTLLE